MPRAATKSKYGKNLWSPTVWPRPNPCDVSEVWRTHNWTYSPSLVTICIITQTSNIALCKQGGITDRQIRLLDAPGGPSGWMHKNSCSRWDSNQCPARSSAYEATVLTKRRTSRGATTDSVDYFPFAHLKYYPFYSQIWHMFQFIPMLWTSTEFTKSYIMSNNLEELTWRREKKTVQTKAILVNCWSWLTWSKSVSDIRLFLPFSYDHRWIPSIEKVEQFGPLWCNSDCYRRV